MCGTTVRRPTGVYLLQTCPTNGIFWTRLRLRLLLTVPTVQLPLLLQRRLQHPLLHQALPVPTPTLQDRQDRQDRQHHQVQPCVFEYGNVQLNDKLL